MVTPGVSFSASWWITEQQLARGDLLPRGTVRGLGSSGRQHRGVPLGGEEVAEGVAQWMEGFGPSELLYAKGEGDPLVAGLITGSTPMDWKNGFYGRPHAGTITQPRQFGTVSLKGFGIEELPVGQCAAGAGTSLPRRYAPTAAHITRIARLQPKAHLGLDRFTLRNLEVVMPVSCRGPHALEALDHCATPMGARTLRRWLTFPLVDRTAIDGRLDAVSAPSEGALVDALGQHLSGHRRSGAARRESGGRQDQSAGTTASKSRFGSGRTDRG